MFIIAILFLCSIYAENMCSSSGRVLVYQDKFQRVLDGKDRIICTEETIVHDGKQKITLQYNLSQNSFIENNQTNKMASPSTPATEPKAPGWGEHIREQIGDLLWNPFAVGAVACVGYVLYCVKSKFSLYSLGKACIEKAAWSLWKNKTTGDDLDAQDTETALLIQILHAYETDNYTVAIARFLQDVEEETELLTAYIDKAKNIQEGMLRFLFEDLSEHINEAQKRLDVLIHIKKIVIGWLHPKKMIALESSLNI